LLTIFVAAGLIVFAVWWSESTPHKPGLAATDPVSVFVMPAIRLLLFWIAPLVAPAILSRQGNLSVGRWVCAAAFCAVAAFFMSAASEGDRVEPDLWTLLNIAFISFGLGVPGCLLAAAIHPKAGPNLTV